MVETPTLIYDGDCRLCGRAARWLELRAGGRVAIQRFQDFPFEGSEGFGPEDCSKAVHWIEPSGRWSRATEACARAFAMAPAGGWAKLLALPGVRTFGDLFYYRVAKNRTTAGKAWRLLSGPDGNPPSFGRGTRFFLLFLGIALFVFGAIAWTEVDAYSGADGLMPFAWTADGDGAGLGAFLESPSLFRFDSSDTTIRIVAALSIVAGAMLAFGFFPLIGVVLGLLSVLSFTSMAYPPFTVDSSRATMLYGVTFADRLLVQVLFVALFVAPLRSWYRWSDAGPGMVGRIAIRLLILRLTWFGPLVNLVDGQSLFGQFEAAKTALWASGSASGLGLRASTSWLGDVLVRVWFVAGLLAPLLVIGPRQLRRIGGMCLLLTAFVFFFFVHAGVFGVLLFALAVSQLDDRSLVRGDPLPGARPQRAWTSRSSAVCLAVLTLFQVLALQRAGEQATEGFVDSTRAALRPLGVLEPFPAWERDRQVRPVLVFSTSADRETWTEWTTEVLPGDPLREDRRFGSLGLSRLDHMLGLIADNWALAAALNAQPSPQGFRSFNRFGQLWLQGYGPITKRLEPVDELDGPPKFLRAQLHAYRPATAEERSRTGRSWLRTGIEYGGVWGLRDGELWRVVR